MKSEFFKKNRNNYLEKCKDLSLSLFFSGENIQKTGDQDYDFEVEKNFYYLSGINQANVILALTKEGDNLRSVLFIEKNDPLLIKWVGKKLEKDQAKEISGIDEIYYLESFKNFLFSTFNNSRKFTGSFSTLYLNLERRNEKNYTNPAKDFSQKFKINYPEVEVLNSYNMVVELRMIKTEAEIALIKDAINTTKGGIYAMVKNLKPGMSENQIEAYFDFHLKFSRNQDHAFKSIVASGKNATILHYVENNSILGENDLLLFDLGARSNFYVSDISRTFPVSGKFNKRQREIYEEVLNVNKKCIEFLKPNLTWGSYNDYAKELLTAACKRLGLIENDNELIKYYYHSIGHSIGLDTHDPANHSLPIQAGMVLTIEPGLYIEEEGIGIRIEDNILITETGNINLSQDIIKEVQEIEEFMATK